MDTFLSRNGLISLIFLGILAFAISNLVGSDNEDGLLMKAARDFTGEAEVEPPKKSAGPKKEAAAPDAVESAEVVEPSQTEGEFADDATLIDNAAGFNPSPNREITPDSERDEVMVLPETAVGELTPEGYEVISTSEDEYE